MTKLKNKIATKLNLNCERKEKTETATKFSIHIVIRLQTANLNSNKSQKLKFLQNSTTQIVTKLKNLIPTIQIRKKKKKSKHSFGKNNLTPQQPMKCTRGSVLISCNAFLTNYFV